jgi:hypothetical protein
VIEADIATSRARGELGNARGETSMGTATYGMNVVDWEARIDVERLRTDRLARLKHALDRSEVGSLLMFDFHNIRYMTATHIGTCAMDKMIRFAVLPRGGEPVLWDFGSAARHHQLSALWLDYRSDDEITRDIAGSSGARAGISLMRGCGAPSARPPALPSPWRARSMQNSNGTGFIRRRSASTSWKYLCWKHCAPRGWRWSTVSRSSWKRAGSKPRTRSLC